VLAVHATGLDSKDYYASVGDAFGVVDPLTGQFTALVSAANAPGYLNRQGAGMQRYRLVCFDLML